MALCRYGNSWRMTCDRAGCSEETSWGGHNWSNEADARYWMSIGRAWGQIAGEDVCRTCRIREETLAGGQTYLNQELEQLRRQVGLWPHWFRQYAGFPCPPGCPECSSDAPGTPSRVYELEEVA